MQCLAVDAFHCNAMLWYTVMQCPTGVLCRLRLPSASNHTRWVVRVHYWDTHRPCWVIFVCLSLYLPVCLPRCLPVCKFVPLSNGLYFRQSVRTFPCFVGLLYCNYARKMCRINCHTCNWPDRQKKRGGKAKKETKSNNQQAHYISNRTNNHIRFTHMFTLFLLWSFFFFFFNLSRESVNLGISVNLVYWCRLALKCSNCGLPASKDKIAKYPLHCPSP